MEEKPKLQNLRADVRGRVQGVGFRQFVLTHALRLKLKGWVQNSPFNRNRVEVEAEGPIDDLSAFLAKLREGPSSSRVESVDVSWCDATGSFYRFEIR